MKWRHITVTLRIPDEEVPEGYFTGLDILPHGTFASFESQDGDRTRRETVPIDPMNWVFRQETVIKWGSE